METKTYKGKILSFLELLNSQKIEIPIIQRDYAQGRIEATEIRKKFLTALYNSIEEINPPLKLDFVYGSNDKDTFLPLDGQQRLTTLFLLHWYAAAKDSVYTEQIKTMLNRFTYETRITSRDFCMSLINSSVDIDQKELKLSDKIINSNWFFLSWKKDPTIDAMLRTLDDIHLIFSSVHNLWNKLNSSNNSITFYYVELENMGLTDDLYIKMNARGKLLSPFENFKASIQNHISEKQWEINKNLNETFVCKLDTEWTDFFWSHYNKNNTVDEAVMRFISTLAMIRLSIEKGLHKSDERTDLISSLQENPETVRPEMLSKDGFDYLFECFETYCQTANNLSIYDLPFPMWRHTPQKSVLSEIVFDDNKYSTIQINSATYTQKVLFFAQTEYLHRVDEFNNEKFYDWMRVVRNIISRGDIDKDGNRPDIIRSPQAFDGVITLINEIADGCADIYPFLSADIQIRSTFAKTQIEEEKTKAKLICHSNDYKNMIFEAEDNELTRGRLEFLFYCIGYNGDIESFDAESFEKVKDVFKKNFSDETNDLNSLRRALLTIEVDDQYEFYGYWWSFWVVIDGATKRRLIDKFRELEYYMHSDYKLYFKKLILSLVEKTMDQISVEFMPPVDMPNWKKLLIKDHSLLDKHNRSNYIAISRDNSYCFLLKSKRPRDLEGCYQVV